MQCGGGSQAPWCCLPCGGDTPARSIQPTPEGCLQYMVCHCTDWKCCTAKHWRATMSTGQCHKKTCLFTFFLSFFFWSFCLKVAAQLPHSRKVRELQCFIGHSMFFCAICTSLKATVCYLYCFYCLPSVGRGNVDKSCTYCLGPIYCVLFIVFVCSDFDLN